MPVSIPGQGHIERTLWSGKSTDDGLLTWSRSWSSLTRNTLTPLRRQKHNGTQSCSQQRIPSASIHGQEPTPVPLVHARQASVSLSCHEDNRAQVLAQDSSAPGTCIVVAWSCTGTPTAWETLTHSLFHPAGGLDHHDRCPLHSRKCADGGEKREERVPQSTPLGQVRSPDRLGPTAATAGGKPSWPSLIARSEPVSASSAIHAHHHFLRVARLSVCSLSSNKVTPANIASFLCCCVASARKPARPWKPTRGGVKRERCAAYPVVFSLWLVLPQ